MHTGIQQRQTHELCKLRHILGSHGTNWFPAPDNKGSRSFGKDNADEINIPEMAAALKGLSINNLMFDACLMGSVEVAAEFAGIAGCSGGFSCRDTDHQFPLSHNHSGTLYSQSGYAQDCGPVLRIL